MNSRGNIVIARLLFDTSCDRSYVSNKFVGKCKPEWVTSKEVLIVPSVAIVLTEMKKAMCRN